jgi:integrase
MSIVRHFCLYRRRSQPHCWVPDPALFPHPQQTLRPYIFSEPEIARLMNSSTRLRRTCISPLRPEVFRLSVVLLYSTGIRLGELLRLSIGDYDRHEQTLLIQITKFHKSRILPLPVDVAGELERYLKARRVGQCALTRETPLIVSRHGARRYTGQGVRHALNTLFKESKIHKPNGRFPRIHDFRHSFAVNALLRWYRAGVDVQSRLPLLAAYMGHVSISSTVYYLHFIEPLRTLASDRFAERYGSLIASEAISERSDA